MKREARASLYFQFDEYNIDIWLPAYAQRQPRAIKQNANETKALGDLTYNVQSQLKKRHQGYHKMKSRILKALQEGDNYAHRGNAWAGKTPWIGDDSKTCSLKTLSAMFELLQPQRAAGRARPLSPQSQTILDWKRKRSNAVFDVKSIKG